MNLSEPPNAFEITESVEPNGVRLILSGELDVAVIDRLQQRLAALAESDETVLLDLSELTFIDSSGLNVIVTAHRRAQRNGSELRIDPNMSRPVHRVVHLMGLDSVFWA